MKENKKFVAVYQINGKQKKYTLEAENINRAFNIAQINKPEGAYLITVNFSFLNSDKYIEKLIIKY